MARKRGKKRRSSRSREVEVATPAGRRFGRSRLMLPAVCVGVAIVVAAVHWPALSAQAISIDDGPYLTENPLVRNPSWSSAERFLTEVLEPSTVAGYYHPLAMISLMLDYAMGGSPDHLRPFHRTSLALHVLNTLLVLLLLYRLFGSMIVAALLALVFGLHPIAVERITWVADRKTVLSATFLLITLLAYVWHAQGRGYLGYAVALVAFVLSLLAKPTSAIAPILLILLDVWPLQRFGRRSLLEKIPFVVLGGVSIIITALGEARTTGGADIGEQGLAAWVLVACHNALFYVKNLLWPVEISVWYPFPEDLGLSHPGVLAGVIFSGLIGVVLLISLRYTRAWMVGWLFFVVGFLPTVGGILRVGDIVAANRFVYVSWLGLLIAAAPALLALLKRRDLRPSRDVRRVMIGGVLAGFMVMEVVLAQRCAERWDDSLKLSEYLVQKAPNEAKLVFNHGALLHTEGQLAEAILYYQRALALQPEDPLTWNNLGAALAMSGRFPEAEEQFRRALAIKPDYAEAHYNLGNVLSDQGDSQAAIDSFRRAVELDSHHVNAYRNLGAHLLMTGRYEEAVESFRDALRLDPGNSATRRNLDQAVQAYKTFGGGSSGS